MVVGCGPSFAPFVDGALLDLLSSSVSHQNRFVRETSFASLSSLVSSGCLANAFNVSPGATGEGLDMRLAVLIAAGMADNWSQVRLAASVTCRQFFQVCTVHFFLSY